MNPEIETAIENLKTYRAGSSRAALTPLDDAVVAALPDPESRRTLERALLNVLETAPSPEACDYICSKLALIGSENSLPSLGKLLENPRASTAARNALEKNASPNAAKLLREAARNLSGAPRIGAIQSLGVLRDASSVSLLRQYLHEGDPELMSAAVFALGEIGTTRAGAALKALAARLPAALRNQVADAILTCAGHLVKAGKNSAVQGLYQAVANGSFPENVKRVANAALNR